jgi:FSR family fosmidomycin resistance protein-like MFS transporter
MSSITAAGRPLAQDARTIGLVGLAHGTSHFFHMLLPPLFPVFIRDFGLNYAQLGLLVTLFFVISGIGQALSGFLVDRIGARPVLFSALCCFALAALTVANAQGLPWLMAATLLAGLGNAPFHPVDFTILNQRVSASRLGHAYSVHGLTGNLGWGAGPVFLLGLSAAFGSWRVAAACAGLWALVVLLALVWNRDAVDDRTQARRMAAAADREAARSTESSIAFLKLRSTWLCFSFFFCSTCALAAVQSFAGPAMQHMAGLTLTQSAYMVTGYMLCGAAGMALGGFMVAYSPRLERNIGIAIGGAALVLLVAGLGVLPGPVAAVLVSLAGLGSGLAGPSRDMLIRQSTPPGATGRVYGMVYSGLDLGFAVSAPLYGMALDRGADSAVFFGAAAMLAMAVVSAGLVGAHARHRLEPG